MINEFLSPKLEDMDVDDVYFQQDGAACHTSGETIGLFARLFFLELRKAKVYANVPRSIQELKDKIRAVIDEIEPQMCENVIENVIKRAWSCKRSHRGHINDIFAHY